MLEPCAVKGLSQASFITYQDAIYVQMIYTRLANDNTENEKKQRRFGHGGTTIIEVTRETSTGEIKDPVNHMALRMHQKIAAGYMTMIVVRGIPNRNVEILFGNSNDFLNLMNHDDHDYDSDDDDDYIGGSHHVEYECMVGIYNPKHTTGSFKINVPVASITHVFLHNQNLLRLK